MIKNSILVIIIKTFSLYSIKVFHALLTINFTSFICFLSARLKVSLSYNSYDRCLYFHQGVSNVGYLVFKNNQTLHSSNFYKIVLSTVSSTQVFFQPQKNLLSTITISEFITNNLSFSGLVTSAQHYLFPRQPCDPINKMPGVKNVSSPKSLTKLNFILQILYSPFPS
jgi:hypothetical protein